MTKTNFSRIAFAVLIMVVLLSMQSLAQDDVNSYKVGEKVEYKDNNKYDSATNSYPVVWLEGTVVRLLPEYRQLLIHWDPRPDYPSYTHNGVSNYEQGYGIAEIRHKKARPVDNPDDVNVDPNPNVKPPNNGGQANGNPQGGKGLMTKQEILGYMKTNGFVNGVAKHDVQVCRDLIEQIKLRGVVARFEIGDDKSPIYENGCATFDTSVDSAAEANVGTPTTIAWLTATWLLWVQGGTVVTTPGDGFKYTQLGNQGNLGGLTINGNGTYTWQIYPNDPPSKYVKGSWRNATKKEMGLQGGAGIVLLKGEGGFDWIVFKKMSAYDKRDIIDVQELQSRGGMRRRGVRK